MVAGGGRIEGQCLWADVLDGPLKGERRQVNVTGATLGRSPDNTVSISDPELSRRHSKIEFDHSDGKVRCKWTTRGFTVFINPKARLEVADPLPLIVSRVSVLCLGSFICVMWGAPMAHTCSW